MSDHDICGNCGLERLEHGGTGFTQCPYPFKGKFMEPFTLETAGDVIKLLNFFTARRAQSEDIRAHIFTDDGKQWKLIPELPEKPAMKNPGVSVQRLYDKALAEAKANALPIVNPETIFTVMFVDQRKSWPINGHLYEWPGTWQRFNWFASSSGPEVIYGAKLIAPQQPQADKLTPNDAGYKYFTCPTCDGSGKISQDQQAAREEKIATQIARKIAAIPENKPEHAADHKLRSIEEIIDNTIKMVERHTGNELRDQLSKERERIESMLKQFQDLHDKFIGYSNEYERESKLDTDNLDASFFKGKCEAYRYAAKRVKDSMLWLGVEASELDKN